MKPADPARATIPSKGGNPLGAANDDHGPAAQVAREPAVTAVDGWDPFEVWRTRVRDPRRDWRAALTAKA